MASLEASLLEGSFQADNKKSSPGSPKDVSLGASDDAGSTKTASSSPSGPELGLSEGEPVMSSREPSLASSRVVRDHVESKKLYPRPIQ
jgi:hypothetical protein